MILPASLEPRAFLGADSISYSELNTLAQCEARWALTYGSPVRVSSPPSPAMALGTEIHRLWGEWWLTGQVPTTEDATAAWVMNRYAAMYGADRTHGTMRMVAHAERPFAMQLRPGQAFPGPYVFGFLDGLFAVRGMSPYADGLWVGELKSSSSIANTLHLEHSTQTPAYVLALRAEGLPIQGSFIDMVCTSGADKTETKAEAYKRLRDEGVPVAEAKERAATERLVKEAPPLHESFTRRWLPASEAWLVGATQQLESAAQVRTDLRAGHRAPLKNIGPFTCKGCAVVAPCFGLTVDIEDEDA